MSVVYLLLLGGVEDDLLRALEQPLHNALHAECIAMNDHVPMRRFFDTARDQYNSTKILHYIKEQFATPPLLSQRHDATHPPTKIFLGVTPFDLFIPVLTYVFGEAELDGNVAVVSYHRLNNELYGLPPNRELLTERFIKEALHELGHTAGLVHCQTQECVMHTSTYVEDIDLKSGEFCPACHRILESRLPFKVSHND